MKKPQLILIVLIIMAIIWASIYFQSRTTNIESTCDLKEGVPDPQWLIEYKSKLTENQTIYLQENEYLDINHPLFKCIAQDIKSSAKSDREAVQMALDY